MKIKLQDYSLISNEFINELDELLDKFMDFSQDKVYLNVTDMKRKIYQLIPAEKLAEHSIEYGAEILYNTLDPNTGNAKGFNELKQRYFNSEIEIQ